MSFAFDRAVDVVLSFEGGYAPAGVGDPGGETKYGISKRYHPDVDIAALTVEQAKDIYLREYWTPLKCDDFEWPLNLVLFDTAVQRGVAKASEMAEAAVWTPAVLLLDRLAHYIGRIRTHPTQVKWLHGWMNRLETLWAIVRAEELP